MILGPILFIIYDNYINVDLMKKSMSYADDTTFLTTVTKRDIHIATENEVDLNAKSYFDNVNKKKR